MAVARGVWVSTALVVAAITAGGAYVMATTFGFSKERIAVNQRARLIASLNSVLSPELRNHDLGTVRLTATDATLLGSPEPIDVFVATERGNPVAAIFASVAPGYNAPIHLLIGVASSGVLTGVRAVSHRETAGLGDRIETEKSPWILQFDGLSLAQPPLERWAVDKDDGALDSMTGATVTSRAVVKAVKNTLLYFKDHRDELFRAAGETGNNDAAPR
jgi:H+/Na+-translocating ferredoxin:NAD+ oxidoreductase subunit G